MIAEPSTTVGNNQNFITLTFNGVDFRLVPNTNVTSTDDATDNCCGVTLMPNTGGKYTAIQLNSFTGTLFVSENHNSESFLASTPGLPAQVASTTIEDEVASPQNKAKDMNVVSAEKGQQQLPFEKKKRNRIDNSDSKELKKKKKNGLRKTKTESVTSPLLGQSSMLSQSFDETDSDKYADSVSTADKSGTLNKNTDNDLELTRKPSIKELVDRAVGDLTQTQHVASSDDMSESQPNNNNTIVEFDEVESSFDDVNDVDVSMHTDLKVDENVPSPRWGNTMTLIDNNKVLVYGGQGVDAKSNKVTTFSDLHVYDLSTRLWKKPVNCEGMPRTWHSSTYLPDRSLLISFGGESYNSKSRKTETTDQVMVLDTEIMLWYPPSVSGQIPSGRSGHTASLLDSTNELVVFGGVKGNKWQNSVAVLDTMRWKWTMPRVAGDAPRARSYHSATPVPSTEKDGNILVIFGGNNDVESFNSVHVLDTTNEEGKWSWFHPNVSGTPPSPRTGHCAVLLEDNKTILIYGGWDPTDEDGSDDKMICGDAFLLDTESWTWKPGPHPKFVVQNGVTNGGKKRTGSSAVLAPGNDLSQVLVFGGRIPNDSFSNDFQTMTVPQRMIDVKL